MLEAFRLSNDASLRSRAADRGVLGRERSGGIAVVRYEYDPDFGVDVPIDDPSDGTGLNFLDQRIDGASISKVGMALRWALGDWVVGMSVIDLIGVGLLLGLLLVMPSVLLIRTLDSGDNVSGPSGTPSIESSMASTVTPTVILNEPRPIMGPPAPEQIVDTPEVSTPEPLVAPASDSVAPAAPAPAFLANLIGGLAEGLRRLRDAPAATAPEEDVGDEAEGPIAAVEKPVPVIGMKAVMDGVRRTARSRVWQRSGLADPGLMQSIDLIFRELRLATGDPTLALPVRFGDVPPGLGDDLVGVLHVAMSPALFDRNARGPSPTVLDGGRASRSILIADGDIVLASAEDCLILATGAVEMSWSTRCVVIAGLFIETTFDTSSVLISGSQVSVRQAVLPSRPPRGRAIYSAPDLVTVSIAKGVIFLNAGEWDVSIGDECRPLEWPALDFDDANRESPPFAWEGRIAPVPDARSYPGGGVDLRVEGVDGPIHVEIGEPILDPEGRLVPELAGWRAYRSTNQHMMFYKDTRLTATSNRMPLMAIPLNPRGGGGR